MAEACPVKGVETTGYDCRQAPGLTSVKKNGENAGIKNADLGSVPNLSAPPYT